MEHSQTFETTIKVEAKPQSRREYDENFKLIGTIVDPFARLTTGDALTDCPIKMTNAQRRQIWKLCDRSTISFFNVIKSEEAESFEGEIVVKIDTIGRPNKSGTFPSIWLTLICEDNRGKLFSDTIQYGSINRGGAGVWNTPGLYRDAKDEKSKLTKPSRY